MCLLICAVIYDCCCCPFRSLVGCSSVLGLPLRRGVIKFSLFHYGTVNQCDQFVVSLTRETWCLNYSGCRFLPDRRWTAQWDIAFFHCKAINSNDGALEEQRRSERINWVPSRRMSESGVICLHPLSLLPFVVYRPTDCLYHHSRHSSTDVDVAIPGLLGWKIEIYASSSEKSIRISTSTGSFHTLEQGIQFRFRLFAICNRRKPAFPFALGQTLLSRTF